MNVTIPNILSVAGSDPSGGAGIQADLKTFSALGCYGMAVLSALTAQNTRGVTGVHLLPPDFVAAQIDAIWADIRVHAVKLGMLANGTIATTVADRLRAHAATGIVLDPVLVATSGDSLGAPDVVDAMRRTLFPLASLVTPNLPEAARLTDMPIADSLETMRATAERLVRMGARAALVKGGHLDQDMAVDVLFDGQKMHEFTALRVITSSTHGTGCTLSSAIAAYLGFGHELPYAVSAAKIYLTDALRHAHELSVGSGHGPVQHFHTLWRDASGS